MRRCRPAEICQVDAEGCRLGHVLDTGKRHRPEQDVGMFRTYQHEVIRAVAVDVADRLADG